MERPVERIAWIVGQVAGRGVLDLGALDETALAKLDTDQWLHGRMARVARSVVGVDRSDELRSGPLETSPRSRIVRAEAPELPAELDLAEVEVVVAGELIEHLPDALGFLTGLARDPRLAGRQLILTTPNATSLHNVLIGLFGRESCHEDHLQVYSYKTLHTLCRRAALRRWEILPYHVSFAEMRLRRRGLAGGAVAIAEKVIRVAEWLFPMLSGGWIVNAEIRGAPLR